MKTTRKFIPHTLALAAAALLGACSSLPADNAALMSARAAFENAQSNAQTRELAAAELSAAGTALNRANEAFTRREKVAEVDHLAYLASQRVAVAQQTARQKAADAQLVSAEAERDRSRLAARTSEADSAQMLAQRSQQEAQAAQRSAAASQMNAQSAQMQTADAQARAMQLEEQLRDLNAKKTDRGMVVTIGDVLFDSGRAELKSGSARDMGKLADFFKANPQRTALVEGFTDSVGSDASNLDLSNRRAAAVQAALANLGVERQRISARGYGEAHPVAGNDNSSGRQMNRRVEIVLSDESGQIKPR